MTASNTNLRALVGHIPLISCVAGVIIFNEGKVLLQRRGDDGNWCIPGGGMDLGETVEETAQREVLEETGIIIDEMKLFHVYSGEEQHHVYPNGDEVYFVNVVFISSKFHGELRVDGVESTELKFFAMNDLPVDLSATNKPIFADLHKRMSTPLRKGELGED